MNPNEKPILPDELSSTPDNQDKGTTLASAIDQDLLSHPSFQPLLHHLQQVFVVYDAELNYQFISEEGVQRLALSRADLLGHNDADSFTPDHTEQYLPLLQQALASKRPQHSEVIFWVGGEAFTFAVEYIPLLDREGQVAQILGVFNDISERKQLEADLQTYRDTLDSILNHSSASICCINVFGDRTWRYEFLSAAHTTIFGYSSEELFASPDLWTRCLLPEDQSVIEQMFESIFAEQQLQVEYRIRRKDGQIRWIADSLTSYRHPDEEGWQVVTVTEDITERKYLELELQQSQTSLSDILNNALCAIGRFRLHPDLHWSYEFLSAGSVNIFGYTVAELLADPTLFASRIPSEEKQTIIRPAIYQLMAGFPCTIEYRFQHKDGSYRWINCSCIARYEQPSDSWVGVAVSTDATERKQATLALESMLQREQQTIHRERLIGAIAQNIRQSLNLNYILSTTVEEVQQFLQAERVIIFRFGSSWNGRVVAEATEEDIPSILDQEIDDPCFRDEMLTAYRSGRIYSIDDVQTANLAPCYAEMLGHYQVRALLVLPILVHHNLWGLLIVHQCSSARTWNDVNRQLLQQLSTQLAIGIHQAELYQQTQQQAQKERLLNRIIQTVRNSLDLDTIFATATAEVGRLLEIDRVEIFQSLPYQMRWLNVASYRKVPDLPNALGMSVEDEQNWVMAQLRQGELVQVQDYAAVLNAVSSDIQSQVFVGSWLHFPVLARSTVWGSLSFCHQQPNWNWQEWELDLASAIADQLAIAIQQSELYHQVQVLNSNLESQVEERTAQLQQALRFEDLLRRIIDKVRESLDEEQIIQIAVQELANELLLDCCDIGYYNHDQQTCVIFREHIRSAQIRPVEGSVIPIHTHNAEIHAQLLRGQYVHFCALQSASIIRGTPQNFAILSCPLIDDQSVLGNIWLFRPHQQSFDDLEIRLVQQVANQCAIALRQSRLYQESLRQLNESERLNLLKDDFLSTISHELRTPLSNIRMATQMLEIMLLRTNVLNESLPANRYFQILKEECQRETQLVNDLLELTRVDAATEPLIPTQINLLALIPHLIEPFLKRLESQNLTLIYDLATDLPPLVTDLSYLERILTELFTNACKYTPAGETVTIMARHRYQHILIGVKNSGVEIPEAERDRVFERFYRIPSSDPWRFGGIGLGLALIKRLVARLGGSIYLDSSPEATTFTLELPMNFDPARFSGESVAR